MSWTLLLLLVAGLGVALCAALSRRAELRRMRASLGEHERAGTSPGHSNSLSGLTGPGLKVGRRALQRATPSERRDPGSGR